MRHKVEKQMISSVESKEIHSAKAEIQSRADCIFPATKKTHRSLSVKAKKDLGDHLDLTSHLTDVINGVQRGIVT